MPPRENLHTLRHPHQTPKPRANLLQLPHAKPIHLVNPLLQVILLLAIFWRARTSREPVRTRVLRGWHMHELEVEQKYRSDPAVDCSIRLYVRVVEHSFNVLRVDFNSEIRYPNHIQLDCL